MTRVLVIGGQGRIGSSVATDLVQHTQVQVTITGRSPGAKSEILDRLGDRTQFLSLDVADRDSLKVAIANHDLVIHCAGPFRQRDTNVLATCIQQGVNYLDVSDDREFTQKALSHHDAALAAGVTAIINTGVFPGISNSMVRQDVEQLDRTDEIHLSYVVAGSGGAGVTVMRTTFLGLQHPFAAWLNGQWCAIQPYTGREIVEFPPPYGKSGVYWFDMPETFTLVHSFPVKTVITKFGSIPDLYNRLTWLMANGLPKTVMQQTRVVEFLAQVSHKMTDISDRFSGTGVAIRSEVRGEKAGQAARHCSTFAHANAATATGCGTGSLAEFVLSGTLKQPGVWPIEQALPTALFTQAMQSRGITIDQRWL